MYTLRENKTLAPVLDQDEATTRRQDVNDTYVLNGAVYVAGTEWLRVHETFLTGETVAYPMPERSADVDTSMDLAWCDFLVSCVEN
jgi:N-acylneuraminate cytidylyltransferase